MPLYDKNLSLYAFLENSQKPSSGFECAAKRRMNINPILGFLWWTAWQQGWLCQAMWTLCKNVIFRTFSATGTARRRFYTARRQALHFWALGDTNFSCLCSFHKTAFPDLVTVQFRWKFDRWFITCCYSLWIVEICIGGLNLEIYITHDWLF